MDYYYMSRKKEIPLRPASGLVAVSYKHDSSFKFKLNKLSSLKGFGEKRKTIALPDNELLLLPVEQAAPVEQLLAGLQKSGFVAPGQLVFETQGGTLLIPDGTVNAYFGDRPKAEIQSLLDEVGATIVEPPRPELPLYVLKPKAGAQAEAIRVANVLARKDGIEAQPRFFRLSRVTPTLSPAPPASPSLVEQWGLTAIKAKQVWHTLNVRGSPETVVAVIDTGVDLEHPDLKENLVGGYDLVDGGDKPEPERVLPADAHGTACAGIIAATGRGSFGISGVAPGCGLLPIRYGKLDYVGGSHFVPNGPRQLPEAILEAVRLKASVISLSQIIEGEDPDLAVYWALRHALAEGREGRGCVVVAGAGNSNNGVQLPARYALELDIIAVAGLRRDGNRCTPYDWGMGLGSCFGSAITVAAPGVDICTTDIHGDSGYSTQRFPQQLGLDYTLSFGGTSAAGPFVAGVAALMLSANPQLSAYDVRDILQKTASKVGTKPYKNGRNDELGYGLVDAFAAVEEALRRLPPGGVA